MELVRASSRNSRSTSGRRIRQSSFQREKLAK